MAQPLRYSRYEVLQHPDGSPQVLGEDTETTIYLAREKESGTPAVLRVPGHRSQRNPAARQRFIEESQEMSQVKHPHIAAVLHFSDTSAGAFCAMEFCDGLTLQKAIEEVGALPWQECFRLALQLSGALESLERHGLVHRGLRSTNIVVTTGPDGHAHLKVTEYGRVSEDSIRDTLAATKSGFVRVPAYASPEEFLAVAPPDARSLQYSLGAVLWFCLTGKPLFEGSQFEVMFQHVNKEPEWEKLPSLPSQLLGILKLVLAKSAGDRFASCAALTAALNSATTGVSQAPKRHAPSALDAPITGPTALAWLKARQTLMLDEVHPMLGQIADLMDASVTEGKDMLNASLEHVLVEIEGWSTLPDPQRSTLLRTPLSGWPAWKVKLAPYNPTDRSERPPSQAMGFMRLCHRLLTGQGKGNGRHVPTAALSPEGNAFFEKHLESHAVRGHSCRRLFELLCEVEEVVLGETSGTEVLATRVVARPGGGAPGAGTGPVATEDRQQAWLARERAALERARRDLSEQEAQRARQLAEEQAHVEKMRKSLEEQKAQLDDKRREQQRLEQELQLRAQLEFQKLQEEAKARDSLLAHKRAAAEDALRQREAEFRARERERFARLEQLKKENDAMEERVQQEYLTLRHVERKHAHNTEQFHSQRMAVPKASPPAPKETYIPPAPQETPRHTPQHQQPQHPSRAQPAPTPSRAASVPTITPQAKPKPQQQHRPQESRAQAAAPPPQSSKPAATPPRPSSGSIVLARLTPIEVPPNAVAPSAQDDSRVQRPIRRRKRLIVVFIGVLVAGVLALIAAAAITLLSENHTQETDSKEKETPQNTPVTDTSEEFQLTTPVTFETTNPGESLRALVREVRADASKRDALRPRALAAVNGLASLPLTEITPFADDIRNAAEAWRMPEAWLALAAITTDEDKRLEHYLQAATLGNVRARTYAGAVQLNKGVASRDATMIGLAVEQLSKAVAEGDADAMLILGDAMYEARGLVQDRKNGRIYVEQAAALGHEGAKDWLKARPVK